MVMATMPLIMGTTISVLKIDLRNWDLSPNSLWQYAKPMITTDFPLCLNGTISVPGDKSISHRSLMLSTLCPTKPNKPHQVNGLLDSADVMATMACLTQLGNRFTQTDSGQWLIEVPAQWQAPIHMLDAKNSGTTMRLMMGLLAPQPFSSSLTGDASLQRRPMGRVLSPLTLMGASIQGSTPVSQVAQTDPDARYAPLAITPVFKVLQGIDYTMPHASAQVKSAILLAGLFANPSTNINLIESAPSRDHTERMLSGMGLVINTTSTSDGHSHISMPCGQITHLRQSQQALDWTVPGDPSSAAFFTVAACLLQGSHLTIKGVGLNPSRIGLVTALKRLGADITITNTKTIHGEPVGDWVVKSARLAGHLTLNAADIPALIDEIPILAVAAVFNCGSLTIRGAEDLRKKESDRLEAIRAEFDVLGINVTMYPDGLHINGHPESRMIEPSRLLEAHHDHRIAMALTVLNICAISQNATADNWQQQLWPLNGKEWVNISYPKFFTDLERLIAS
jgi:3-phosphoshikimate 1-carboxyvinyltransferase